MGSVLGWGAATVAREVEHYRARVAAERESQQQPDDRTADAARLGAPDVRMGGIHNAFLSERT
jgi:glycerol-3-phosphate dehydrogenase